MVNMQSYFFINFYPSLILQPEYVEARPEEDELDVAQGGPNSPSDLEINDYRPTVLEYFAADFFQNQCKFLWVRCSTIWKIKTPD